MEMNNSRVFITQENPNLNYLPAEQFGEIVFLTHHDYSVVRNSLRNEAVVEEIRTNLRNYDPKNDYIVISGSPVIAGIVFMILREKTEEMNILRWSNRDHLYQHLVVSIKPINRE